MNNQLDYLVAKAHVDDLVRAAERARMAGGGRSRTSTALGRAAARLRRVSRRPARVCAECP